MQSVTITNKLTSYIYDTTLCDKGLTLTYGTSVIFTGTPASSTNRTDSPDITEIFMIPLIYMPLFFINTTTVYELSLQWIFGFSPGISNKYVSQWEPPFQMNKNKIEKIYINKSIWLQIVKSISVIHIPVLLILVYILNDFIST